MEKSEQVLFTNMCMICDGNGNVLVQDRRGSKWPGITFPGGHVEQGESFIRAVIREVYEETGLTIRNPRLCGIRDRCGENGRNVVLLYQADRFSGKPTSSDEGEVYWMKIDEIKNANLSNGMESILRAFLDDDIGEIYFCKENGEWREEII